MWGVLVFLYNKKNERAKLGREMNDVVAFGVFLLIVVIWFFFCINFFYNNLTPRNFEPCGWYLWWSQTFVGGSRMTAVEYDKWDSFVDPLSRRDDVGIILGELCFVNQLFHSWFHNSFCWIEDVNHKFNYMYEQIFFHVFFFL